MLIACLLLSATCSIIPVDLRVENLTQPQGVDLPHPRFSWKIGAASAAGRDLFQSAYQVQVTNLDGQPIWLPAKVTSSDTAGIVYAGKPLPVNAILRWQVKTWDQNGVASEWSKPAQFTTGLHRSDWTASWITYAGDPAMPVSVFDQSHWIWSDANGVTGAPVTSHTFTLHFNLPEQPRVSEIDLTADDRFELTVNGVAVGSTDGKSESWRTPRHYALPGVTKGSNTLEVAVSNLEASPAGMIATLRCQMPNGTWITKRTGVDGWLTELGNAVPVASYGLGPWGKFESPTPPPAFIYRRSFPVTKRLKRATLFGTALGLVDFRLNGQDVSEDLFTPGWSDYDKRVYYRAYDVTRWIQNSNDLEAIVGDGWFSGYVGYGHRRAHYGPKPMVKAQLMLEYADGTRQTISTDRRWQVCRGPITQNDFLMGETYDGNVEGTSNVELGMAVEAPSESRRNLEWFPGDPVRRYARIQPKTITRLAPDKYLLDFGQNLAGFVRITTNDYAAVKTNRPIVIRFGEALTPDGQLYVDNLRGAKAIDTYIPFEGRIDWQPRFTFHGFRYAEVTGIGRTPKPDEFTAIAISSATPETGTLETSDPILNKIVKNAWWTQKMNFIDIPTDCPQRDERLGWMGDAQAYIRTAATYSDVQAFFTKWLDAVDDSQRADGQYPMVAPLKVADNDGGPAWSDAGVICPWTIYDVYGDKRELARHYPNMKRFIDFMQRRSKPNLLPPDRYQCFGDWLNIDANTPPDVIYMAYFAGSARLVSQAAAALGNQNDADRYEKLYEDVRKAFNDHYVAVDGVVAGDTQCAYVLALAFDLLDADKSKMAADRLVADIERRGWHLSTGFVGTRDLMHVLSKIGRNDVAFRLLHNTTFPSWGFEVVNGATSIWERWDGWTPAKGFQDPGMNSFAHYAYGAVVGWMFQQVGGIQNIDAGYRTIRIAPQIDPNLTWARAKYNSVRGPIVCKWWIQGSALKILATIPPNTTAEVAVPRADGAPVIYRVGSGTYTFTSTNPNLRA